MKLRLESCYLITMLLLALLLALTIGIELGWGHRISLPLPLPKPQKTRIAALPLPPEFGLPPLEQTYTEMLGRPLFVPARRPPSPPVPVGLPQSTMRKGQYILVGVIIDNGKNIALLREVAGGKMLRVEQGKEINGMQLEKLEPEKITLKQGEEREEVVLKIKSMLKTSQPVPSGTSSVPGQPGAPAASLPAQPGTPVIAPVPPDMQAEQARHRALRGLPP